MEAKKTAEMLRTYIWTAMEVMDNHKDRPDVVETGREKMATLLAAEEAVKKQIPLRTEEYKKTKLGDVLPKQHKCPTCNSGVYYEDKFCKNCGQALDTGCNGVKHNLS